MIIQIGDKQIEMVDLISIKLESGFISILPNHCSMASIGLIRYYKIGDLVTDLNIYSGFYFNNNKLTILDSI